MPELAELKLTADYINESASGLKYKTIEKNPVHKGEEVNKPFNNFEITAESRGKELVLNFLCPESKKEEKLFMTMGMSGHFSQTYTGDEKKHAHLKFRATNGTTLSFVDVRRFGKWKFKQNWSKHRSPDPTQDFKSFKDNVYSNLDRAAFNHPIHLALMNQKYFNGIGNYLRAEILYRLPHIDPFLNSREVILNEPRILEMCRDIPNLAYIRGGGSIRDWDNPFGESAIQEKFMLCYGNPDMSKVRDKNGRMFWYDSKWDKKGE